jgi:hypothetical protein
MYVQEFYEICRRKSRFSTEETNHWTHNQPHWIEFPFFSDRTWQIRLKLLSLQDISSTDPKFATPAKCRKQNESPADMEQKGEYQTAKRVTTAFSDFIPHSKKYAKSNINPKQKLLHRTLNVRINFWVLGTNDYNIRKLSYTTREEEFPPFSFS